MDSVHLCLRLPVYFMMFTKVHDVRLDRCEFSDVLPSTGHGPGDVSPSAVQFVNAGVGNRPSVCLHCDSTRVRSATILN